MGNQVDLATDPNLNRSVYHKDGEIVSAFPCICQGDLYPHLVTKKQELQEEALIILAAHEAKKEETNNPELESKFSLPLTFSS